MLVHGFAPASNLQVTLCQRQVVFAPGRAIKGASRRAANNGPEVRSSHLCHITR